jgi:hypothetical protein
MQIRNSETEFKSELAAHPSGDTTRLEIICQLKSCCLMSNPRHIAEFAACKHLQPLSILNLPMTGDQFQILKQGAR